jgi:hypothetical protein
MPRILNAQTALDRHFLETRCKLIEIAANLDRIAEATGADATATASDKRLSQIRAALDVIASKDADKAERCQMIFSQPYDQSWKTPNHR